MTRRPRHRRDVSYPRMVLTERDRQIILAVHENRFLKRGQIERLFFATTSAANQRLAKLFHHGFLDRLYLPVEIGSAQAVYALDKKGADFVAGEQQVPVGRISWRRKHNRVEFFFLEHTVGVAEVNVALQLATRGRDDVELILWKREAFLPKDRVRDPDDWEEKLPVAPDAFFGIHGPQGRSFFFVEVDMGTENLERVRSKLVAYQEYWRSGTYQERYGVGHFRVLTITTGPQRLANLIDVAAGAGAKNMFLFSTAEAVSRDVLGPIWRKPNTVDPITILD